MYGVSDRFKVTWKNCRKRNRTNICNTSVRGVCTPIYTGKDTLYIYIYTTNTCVDEKTEDSTHRRRRRKPRNIRKHYNINNILKSPVAYPIDIDSVVVVRRTGRDNNNNNKNAAHKTGKRVAERPFNPVVFGSRERNNGTAASRRVHVLFSDAVTLGSGRRGHARPRRKRGSVQHARTHAHTHKLANTNTPHC